MKNYICNWVVYLFQMLLKILLETLSYPVEFFSLRDLIMLFVSVSVTGNLIIIIHFFVSLITLLKIAWVVFYLGIISIAPWDIDASFIFTWYSNSICYPIIILPPLIFIHNWKILLKVIQRDTTKEMKHTINIINIVCSFPCLIL
jgi:hypothetical protein